MVSCQTVEARCGMLPLFREVPYMGRNETLTTALRILQEGPDDETN